VNSPRTGESKEECGDSGLPVKDGEEWGWIAFPGDIKDNILVKFYYKSLVQFKAVSKQIKDRIESDGFLGFGGKCIPERLS
jgi:hypothetical protein